MVFLLTLAIALVTSDKITGGTIVMINTLRETNLLTLLNNIYLMFYAKEIDIST